MHCAGAWWAYRNARDVGRTLPPGEPVPLADGMPASRLARSAETLMARLQERVGGAP